MMKTKISKINIVQEVVGKLTNKSLYNNNKKLKKNLMTMNNKNIKKNKILIQKV